MLSFTPLRALGLISYGVYLYHWPVFLWLTPERTGLDGVALFGERMALTIALATVSYLWIEQPIRHGHFTSGWRPAAVAALGAATVAALFVNLPGAPSSSRIVFRAVNRPAAALAAVPGANDASASLPVTGPPAGSARVGAATTPTAPPAAAVPAPVPPPLPPVQRIMVVGDSVAQTLGRGLERWGPDHGVSVLNAARFYCGIARGGRLSMALGHTAKHCEDWGDRWPATLDRFRPDVVVVLSTIWDVGARQRDEWGPDYLNPGDPRFDQFVIDEWRQAVTVLGSRGARVIWLTNPCAAEDPLTRVLQYANGGYMPALVGSTPVIRLDFSADICPDGTFRDQLGPVADARPDGLHFSDAGADWIATWLGPQLADPYLQNAVGEGVRLRRF